MSALLPGSNQIKQLRKNFVIIGVGQVAEPVINFILVMLIARGLSVEDFGWFSFAIAIISLFAKGQDLASQTIFFREFSKKHNSHVLEVFLRFRLILIFIIIGLLHGYYILFQDSINYLPFALLSILVIISPRIDSLRTFIVTIFKAIYKNIIPVSILLFEGLILLLAIGVVLYFGKTNLLNISFLYIAIPFIGLFGLMLFLKQEKFNRLEEQPINRTDVIKYSAPLLILTVLDVIFLQMDIFILKSYLNLESVGIYSIAMRLSIPLLFIPYTFVNTLFPIWSKNQYMDEGRQLRLVFKFLLLMGVFISFSFFFKAEEIISLIFGTKYIDSAFPASMFIFGQIFNFWIFIGNDYHIAKNKLITVIILKISLLIINLLGIFLLTPISYDQLAIAKLISFAIIGIAMLTIFIRVQSNFYIDGNVVFILMAVVMIYLFSFLNLFLFVLLTFSFLVFFTLFIPYFTVEEKLIVFPFFTKMNQ